MGQHAGDRGHPDPVVGDGPRATRASPDLTEEERDLLDVASCCGFEFDPSARRPRSSGEPVIPRLQDVWRRSRRRHRLVRSAGDCRFVRPPPGAGVALRVSLPEHASARSTTRPSPTRSRTREGAADKEADAKPPDGGDFCVELCDHYSSRERAKRREALRYLDAALDPHGGRLPHEQAVELMERALGVPGSWQAQARSRFFCGERCG